MLRQSTFQSSGCFQKEWKMDQCRNAESQDSYSIVCIVIRLEYYIVFKQVLCKATVVGHVLHFLHRKELWRWWFEEICHWLCHEISCGAYHNPKCSQVCVIPLHPPWFPRFIDVYRDRIAFDTADIFQSTLEMCLKHHFRVAQWLNGNYSLMLCPKSLYVI